MRIIQMCNIYTSKIFFQCLNPVFSFLFCCCFNFLSVRTIILSSLSLTALGVRFDPVSKITSIAIFVLSVKKGPRKNAANKTTANLRLKVPFINHFSAKRLCIAGVMPFHRTSQGQAKQTRHIHFQSLSKKKKRKQVGNLA